MHSGCLEHECGAGVLRQREKRFCEIRLCAVVGHCKFANKLALKTAAQRPRQRVKWTSGTRIESVSFPSRVRSLDRSIARSLDRSIARSIERLLDRSIARWLARSLDRSLDRSHDPSLARSLDRFIKQEVRSLWLLSTVFV